MRDRDYEFYYTQEYIDSLAGEYKKVTNEQIFHVALDMLKGTSGEFSRKAILGYNLTQYPIKIQFRDLSELNESYASYDAVGWKRKNKLYIYINPKHDNAPPGALAALLALLNVLKKILLKKTRISTNNNIIINCFTLIRLFNTNYIF